MKAILAIDQSTQSTKAMLFDEGLAGLSSYSLAHAQHYPKEGWVEHDAGEIYKNVIAAAKAALKGLDGRELAAVAVSNQRETVVFWDRKSGEPCRRAIVWQDARAGALKLALSQEDVRLKSGMPLSPLFSAAKIKWALEHDEAVKALYRQGRLCAGTVDSYLVFRLTGNFFCDATNACRTQLMNIDTLAWDADLCAAFGIDPAILPGIRRSDELFGYTDLEGALEKPVPVCGVVGDSQGAFLALGCARPGLAKTSYGTGSSVMANVGAKPVLSKRLAATVGIATKKELFYALEGNISHSADVVSWMCGEMELCEKPADTEALAKSVPSTGGVYLVPAFTGLGAPWWAPDARALLCGMSRGTTKAHVVRAGLEAIAYQIADVLDAIGGDAGIDIQKLHADGGASANGFLMQFQADILGSPVHVARMPNLSALGAAMLAEISLGIRAGAGDAAALCAGRAEYHPRMDEAARAALKAGWQSAVRRVLGRE